MKKLLSLALAMALCLGLTVSVSAYDSGKAGQATTVSLGGQTLAVVDNDNTLWMCGQDAYGDLGNGTLKSSTSFIKVMENVSSVSCGGSSTAVIKTDGSLWVFTYHYYDDEFNYFLRFTPKKVMDDVISVSYGDNFIAAIKADGSLWTWGENHYGQLGNGTTEDSTVPVQVLENVAAVSCGSGFMAAIKTDGSLWMCGSKSNLGGENNDKKGYQTVPIKIMEGVCTVSCGISVTTAVKTDGSLWVWGFNAWGQMANGTIGWDSYTTPQKILDDVVSVCNGASHSAAIKADGSLWMWGDNDCGQVGNDNIGTTYASDGTPYQLKPTKIMEGVASVTCGDLNTAIVKTNGSIWFCGRSNYIGGVGNGTDKYGFSTQTVPVQLLGVTAKLSSPATIAAKVGGFSDVLETDYYADAVLWAVDKGITSGTSATTFSPDTTCTTAQILTFLWRSQGQPEPTSKTNPFTDVKANDYYYKAALWAHEKGLVSGTALNGGTACTRSATVTYLWKLAGSPTASPATFTDVPSTADFSQAVAWAVKEGITSGTSSTMFSPETVCSRGQIVTFLYRAFSR